MYRYKIAILTVLIFLLVSNSAFAQTNGFEVINAMYKKYEGKWYNKFVIEQQVIRYRGGEVISDEVVKEYLKLPGMVRSNMGDLSDGNCEIFLHDHYYTFEDGKITRDSDYIHNVLLLGFDVYLQDTEKTINLLKMGDFDLNKLYETNWQNRKVYVVGAENSIENSNQFWVDKEHLYFVRIKAQRPGYILDIECNQVKRVEGGWVATELVFKRDSEKIIYETYLDYYVPKSIDPNIFNIETLNTEPVPEEPVSVEFRLCSDKPAAGYKETTLYGTDQKFYIHDKVHITNKDITNAVATESPQDLMIELTFNSEGARKFADLTGANINKRIGMLLDGKLITAPRVMAKIDQGIAIIPMEEFTPKGAQRLARGILIK
ncbi:hypothetical protein ACFL5P_01890 [candidate division KSB1 bacterium]